MMRSAFREDEWMLYAHGAVMGFAGGVLHLLLFGAGGAMSDRRGSGRWVETTEAAARHRPDRRRDDGPRRWRGPRAPTSAPAGCWPGR